MSLLLKKLLIPTKTIKSKLQYLLILVLVSCGGLSSGLYKDILEAQDFITNQKFEKAAKVYEKILLKKPPRTIKIKINFQLGEIYSIYLNNFDKSIEHFNQIVLESNEPKWQVDALEKIANIYFSDMKNFKKASEIYLKLKNFYPTLDKQSLYSFRYAESILSTGEYTNAIKLFEKIIENEKNEFAVRSYYNIGLAFFYTKKYEEALSYWFEYLKREKRTDRVIQTKFLIANAYESSENLKKAYNVYYSILGEYPNADVIKNRLESLYKRRIARKR